MLGGLTKPTSATSPSLSSSRLLNKAYALAPISIVGPPADRQVRSGFSGTTRTFSDVALPLRCIIVRIPVALARRLLITQSHSRGYSYALPQLEEQRSRSSRGLPYQYMACIRAGGLWIVTRRTM
jgi:hypothetical protein